MKQNYTLLTLICLLFLGFNANAQVYVNQAATGANDGTSWADAYTNLTDALAATAAGDVWVAAGTYATSDVAGDTSAVFFITDGVNLYGGFAGTEASVDERDISANTTTLTADILGDDDPADLIAFRADNAHRVILVGSGATTCIIDGFNVTGGNANLTADDILLADGAGILAVRTSEIRNCTFMNNSAQAGAGVCLLASDTSVPNNSIVENCTFMNNSANSQSGGLFLGTLDGCVVRDCVFEANSTTRGALYPLRNTNILIERCLFKDNDGGLDGFGGAMFMWNNDNAIIRDVNFEGNINGNGGAIYIDGRELVGGVTPESVKFENCVFDNNLAGGANGAGGAIRGFNAAFSLEGCEFIDNTSVGSGGAMLLNGDDAMFEANNTEFSGNAGTFGGAVSHQSLGSYEYNNCTWVENSAGTSGGAAINSFGSNVTMNDNLFELNNGSFAGAISSQNDTTTTIVNRCIFRNNSVANNGGAMIFLDNVAQLTKCHFIGNEAGVDAGTGFGGAISMTGGDEKNETSRVNFERCYFYTNAALQQGGAVNIFDQAANFTNCSFASNFNDSEMGSGGAISQNAGDTATTDMVLMNCSFGDNVAPIGSSLGLFTTDLSSELTVSIQNCVFSDEDDDLGIEGGTPTATSNGGNLSTDASMAAVLTATNDQVDVADMGFVDSFEGNLSPTPGSPAIDNGVADNAPRVDLNNRERTGDVDSGAYEGEISEPTSAEEVEVDPSKLSVSPNPVAAVMNVELNNDWRGVVMIRVFDATGKMFTMDSINKKSDMQNVSVNVEGLAPGVYSVLASQADAAITTQIVKL